MQIELFLACLKKFRRKVGVLCDVNIHDTSDLYIIIVVIVVVVTGGVSPTDEQDPFWSSFENTK